MPNMKKSSSVLLALTAVIITVFSVWFVNRPAPLEEGTWDDVLAEAETGGYSLITTEELADLYQRDSDLLLVDTRQEWEYRTGHIKGARNFSMEPTWWERWTRADELDEFLGGDKDQTIVFY